MSVKNVNRIKLGQIDPYARGATYLSNWIKRTEFPQLLGEHTTDVSSTTSTPTINIGSPAAGQRVIVAVRATAGSGTNIAFPAGWSSPYGTQNSDASDDAWNIAHRSCDGTEGATIGLTYDGGAVRWAAVALRFSGAGTVANISLHQAETASSLNVDQIQHSGWGIRDYCFIIFASWEGNATVSSRPTGYTGSSIVNTGSAGAGLTTVSWSYRFLRDYEDNPGALTLSGSSNSMFVGVAVRPG